MPIDLSLVKAGNEYSRHELARLWSYKSFHALARGVVTPAGDSNIVLFVTRDKQEAAEQYRNELNGNELRWEGPTDHFAEQRMLKAKDGQDQIHIFYRERHHTDFTYLGHATVSETTLRIGSPSSFIFTF